METNLFSFLEWTAAIAGLVSVYLLTRQSVWAWPAGLLSVSIYVFIFYQNKLYSDFILHMIYVVLNAFGWWKWTTHTADDNPTIKVTLMSQKWRWIAVLGILIFTFIWADIIHQNTDGVFVLPDAFILVTSLVAQYLLAVKKIENWVLWILVDVIAIVIYFLKELYVTSGLYLLYLFLCVSGLVQWRKELNKSTFITT